VLEVVLVEEVVLDVPGSLDLNWLILSRTLDPAATVVVDLDGDDSRVEPDADVIVVVGTREEVEVDKALDEARRGLIVGTRCKRGRADAVDDVESVEVAELVEVLALAESECGRE
jgi:hypothetical protein